MSRVAHDLWVGIYALVTVIVLNVLIPHTPQGKEFDAAPLGDVASAIGAAGVAPHDVLPTAGRVLAVILAVAYCAACVAVAGFASFRTPPTDRGSSTPYWLAFLCVLSALGLAIGSWAQMALTYATIAVLLLAAAFSQQSPAVHRRHLRIAKSKYAIHGRRLLLAIGAAIFVVTCTPGEVRFARDVTGFALLYAGLGFWTLLFTLVFISWPRRAPKLRMSLWLVPVGWAAFCGIFNDNHALRTVPETTPRVALADRAQSWLAAHCPPPRSCTVRFVAAQGGGQRAAFWTVLALQRLNEIRVPGEPAFDDTVFAASGVSGGAIGITAYYLARETDPASLAGAARYRARVNELVSDDNLAPIMGSFAFGNFLQFFVPFPVPLPGFDRAIRFDTGLEETWAHALARAPNRLAAPFASPRDGPALFLNGTNVETGRRVVISDVAVGGDAASSAYSLFDLVPSVPTSTAMHLASRFAYVNPHATVWTPAGAAWGRIVDGGYYDNDGLSTAVDVMQQSRTAFGAALHGRAATFELYYISNNPDADDALDFAGSPVPLPVPLGAKLVPAESELRAPLDALQHGETAFQGAALRALANPPKDGATPSPFTVYEVSLARLAAARVEHHDSRYRSFFCDWKPALGWWLSERSKDLMRDLVATYDTRGSAPTVAPKALCDSTASRSGS
ncbi:MAG TPA: hypothetical protein VFB22_06650 [Candidatus Baltobacteraceae bacterium]|nr:hypothetical protein [Candidatus Baltobacteraceae bacterium]